MPARPAPRLSDLAVLVAALEWDAQQPARVRAEFDQALAPAVRAAGSDPVAAGRSWLDAALVREPALAARQQRIESALGWSTTMAAALGAVAGWLATLGVFYYDGSHRVNVVLVLAVLVVLPALFLLGFVLAALPPRALRWLPGAGWAEPVARGLSPARWAFGLARWLPADGRETWDWWRGRMAAQRTLYGGVQKWILLRASQRFALGYQTAAIVTATGLVIFTDLAFGWSTTLTTGDATRDAVRVHRATTALSSPWSNWVPDGTPSLDLIQSSRYFRAAPAALEPERAARLGGWWRFVVLTILAYGWLPRVATTWLAQNRLRAHLRVAWAATPGLAAVLRRARAAHVQTSAGAPEVIQANRIGRPTGAPAAQVLAPVTAIINWGAAPIDDADAKARWSVTQVHHAGGSATVQADEATIAATAAGGTPGGDVVILVKAWEPPLLEFTDFIRALRVALGRARSIRVLPVALDPEDRPTDASAAQLGVWQRQLQRLGDPWLQVVAWSAEDAA